MEIKSGRWPVRVAVAAGLALGGCAARPSPYQGLDVATPVTTNAWAYEGEPGRLVKTPHYDIFTTIPDSTLTDKLCEVMEGALSQYERVAPGVPVSDKPMLCYIFNTRADWTRFTRQHTGVESYTYLKINRGGYTRGDWYVAYFIGEGATLSVAAHEGWHQFVNRNFKGRLPPFLEEGIATMFEDIDFGGQFPRWNLTINRTRLQSLRAAVEGKYLIPLGDLITLHAGNVVDQGGNRIEAFYSQNWAFATFLWSAQQARYRPVLRRILSDTADGSVFDPTGSHQNKFLPWNPAGVRPMLEHYLGKPLGQIDTEYQAFIRRIAFDDYADQFPS